MRGFSLDRTYRVRIETARIMNAALTENRIFFLGIEGAPQNRRKNIPLPSGRAGPGRPSCSVPFNLESGRQKISFWQSASSNDDVSYAHETRSLFLQGVEGHHNANNQSG